MKTISVARPRKRARVSFFCLLPREAIANVVRHLSAHPGRRHWLAGVSLTDARAVVAAGGRLGACARREFARAPADIYFGKLHTDVLLHVLRSMSDRPGADDWQAAVRPAVVAGLLRGGGVVAEAARAELLWKRGRSEAALRFDGLTDRGCRNVLRWLSGRPEEEEWWRFIGEGEGEAVEAVGGRILEVYRKLGE